jgi:protein SCO1/2
MTFSRSTVIGLSTFALALALLTFPLAEASAHSLEQLEKQLFEREPYVEFVEKDAPDFALLDAEGRQVTLDGLRGIVVVLNFIYASCPDFCPLHTDKIVEIQKLVNETPMREMVEFISITTDPVRDTPDVLREYGPDHGLDSYNWRFLTSGADRPEATRALADRYGLKFEPKDEGYILHGVVTFVIDRQGQIRARFHGLKFNSVNLVLYVNALVNDVHE